MSKFFSVVIIFSIFVGMFFVGTGAYNIYENEKTRCVKFNKPALECSCAEYPNFNEGEPSSWGINCMYYEGLTSGRISGYKCAEDLLNYFNAQGVNIIGSDISCKDAFDKLEIKHIEELDIKWVDEEQK